MFVCSTLLPIHSEKLRPPLTSRMTTRPASAARGKFCFRSPVSFLGIRRLRAEPAMRIQHRGQLDGGTMNRVVHFELGAIEPARAVEFYKSVFGWEAQKWGAEEYYLMKTGSAPEAGIDGAILRNKDSQPRTVNSVQVNSLEDSAAKVESHGGQSRRPQNDDPGRWLCGLLHRYRRQYLRHLPGRPLGKMTARRRAPRLR